MFIIGDIHGCYDELVALLAAAGVDDGETVVSVGDLVDRGPDPGAVIDLFRTRPHAVALCGNHERKHVRGVLSYSQQVTAAQLGDGYAAAVAWMATLPYHLETDAARVVHFGLYPGVPLDEVPADVRAGTTSGTVKLRERFGDTPWWELDRDPRPACFGHAIMGPEPLVVDGRIFGLDTGACHGMALTGVRLPERRIFSVPARADHWDAVKRTWQAPVLRRLPWAEMTFAQLDRRLAQLRDPELGDAPLAAVAAWRDALRTALPELRARLDGELARLTDEHSTAHLGLAISEHPAHRWLRGRQLGRFTDDHLGCSTFGEVLALGRALGVTLPTAPL